MSALGSVFVLGMAFLWSPLLLVAHKGLDIEAHQALWSRNDLWSAATSSVILGLASSALSVTVGTLTALGLRGASKRLRMLVLGSLLFPMVLPEIAMGLSLLVGFVQMEIPMGWTSLILSHMAFTLVFATLVLLPGVDQLQWSLMDAARDLGASRWSQWRHAWAPQLKTAWLSSFLLCFGVSFDDYLISTFVKGVDVTTLPVQLFSMLRVRVKDEVYAMSLLLFCISIAVVLVSQWWKQRRQQTPAV